MVDILNTLLNNLSGVTKQQKNLDNELTHNLLTPLQRNMLLNGVVTLSSKCTTNMQSLSNHFVLVCKIFGGFTHLSTLTTVVLSEAGSSSLSDSWLITTSGVMMMFCSIVIICFLLKSAVEIVKKYFDFIVLLFCFLLLKSIVNVIVINALNYPCTFFLPLCSSNFLIKIINGCASLNNSSLFIPLLILSTLIVSLQFECCCLRLSDREICNALLSEIVI